MLTYLDLLVIVFAAIVVSSILSVGLMFLVKNSVVQRICFYLVVALGIYLASVGIRIGLVVSTPQCVLGVIVGIAALIAFLMERMGHGDEKKFLIARILSAVTVLVGIIAAFM